MIMKQCSECHKSFVCDGKCEDSNKAVDCRCLKCYILEFKEAENISNAILDLPDIMDGYTNTLIMCWSESKSNDIVAELI